MFTAIQTHTIAFSLLLLLHSNVQANQRVAVLDIELNDYSALPKTPAELARTTSFKPLLETALKAGSDIAIMPIKSEAVALENGGFGYLLRFHEVVAKLGKSFGADWVVLGQHSKDSFLYSDLLIQLVNVKTGTLAARYTLELKGNNADVTQHAMDALALKIEATLKANTTP
jgi:Protein of unknown function (DUF2380)